jgi:hypothetical protein
LSLWVVFSKLREPSSDRWGNETATAAALLSNSQLRYSFM